MEEKNYSKVPVFENGLAQPVFKFTDGKTGEKYDPATSSIVRYCVYVESDYDMDGDGKPDLEIYETTATSQCDNKKKLDKDIYLSNGTSGYIIGFPKVTYGNDWKEERDYLWPIPADQRVLTQGILTQNPGWEDGLSY